MVVSVNEGFQGIGKIKVNNHEELCDVEGMLQIMSKGDTEVGGKFERFLNILKVQNYISKLY